jgi:hypothetical protein
MGWLGLLLIGVAIWNLIVGMFIMAGVCGILGVLIIAMWFVNDGSYDYDY